MISRKILLPVLLSIVIIIAPWLIKSQYTIHLLIMVAVYILLSQGLNILLGYINLLSLGQEAYFAIGAYASALMALRLGWPFWITFPLALLVTLILGLAIGYVTLKLRGAYFIIVTIGFAEIVRLITLNVEGFFGGAPGLRNIPAPQIHIGNLINYDFQHTKIPHYYLVWFFVLVCMIVTSRLINSRQGRALVAVRENEMLAEAVGINAFGHAMLGFAVAVIFSGIAGVFYGHYISHISPALSAWSWALTMLIMVIFGGQGTLWGPMLGAFIFTFLPEWLRAAEEFRLPIYGVILMAVVLFFPHGLWPKFDQFGNWLLDKLFPQKGKPIPGNDLFSGDNENGASPRTEEV